MNKSRMKKINKITEEIKAIHNGEIEVSFDEVKESTKDYYDKRLISIHQKQNDFAIWAYENKNKLKIEYDDLFLQAESMKIWYNSIYSDEEAKNFIYKDRDTLSKLYFEFIRNLDIENEEILFEPVLQKLFVLKESKGYFVLLSDGTIEAHDVILDLINREPNLEIHEKLDVTKDFNGLKFHEAIQLLEKYHLVNDSNDLSYVINKYYLKKEFYFKFLYYVLYSIINSGNDLSTRKALMFAHDFNLNIDIPLQYGINEFFSSSKETKKLIDEYLSLGGNVDLECIQDYIRILSNYIEDEEIKETVKLKDLLNKQKVL